MNRRMRVAIAAAAAAGTAVSAVTPPPANAKFDYQIGGDYPPPAGVTVVSRDWFAGSPLTGVGTYSICYVNAYQTQDDEPSVNRPDERSNWPRDLVLFGLGDDPNWGGEYLIDISTNAKRTAALNHVKPMIDTCASKGFKAVEFDNLDSWTRYDDTALAGQVPFGQTEAVAFAKLLTDYAHSKGLAVGQKNTPQLGRSISLGVVGFDFAIAEECGFYRECPSYTAVFGNNVIAIEYTNAGYRRACRAVGATVSVVRRDVLVTKPGSSTYRYKAC
jgi:Glycoside-hydrolase family GH114